MRTRAFAVLLIMGTQAASGNVPASFTTGLRIGGSIGQELLATPPLPSLEKDDMYHLSTSVGYISGSVDSGGPLPNGDPGYVGKPEASSIGIGFTSPSRGKWSYFGYGTAMEGRADVRLLNPPINARLTDTKISVAAAGLGFNYVALGSLKSRFALGIFAGGLFATTTQLFTLRSDQVGIDPESWSFQSRHYGPIVGLQFKARLGPVEFNPYVMTYVDSTNHCVAATARNRNFSFSDKCGITANNSFTAAGLGLGIGGIKAVVYTQVWTHTAVKDLDIAVYQLGYTFDL